MQGAEHGAHPGRVCPLHRHRLRKAGRLVQVFELELAGLRRQILDLMLLPETTFRSML